MNIFLAFMGILALAADQPPSMPIPIKYELENLKPIGMSQYASQGQIRQYLKFQGSQGRHFFIYEESSAAVPAKEMAALQSIVNAASNVTCYVELECTTKAFCTGDCKNFYYEFSNTAVAGNRNRCSLLNFDCDRVDLPAIAPTLAPSTSGIK